MESEHVISIHRTVRWVIVASRVALALLLIAVLGCALERNGAQRTAPNARKYAASVDPTGTAARNIAIEELASQIKSLLDEFDVEELNGAVQDMRKVMGHLSQRLDAVPPGDVQSASGDVAGSMKAVRAQLERTHLAEAIDAVRAAAERIDAAVKPLDLQRANEAIDATKDSVARIRTEVEQLSGSLGQTIDNLGRQLDKAGDKIESLPVQALAEDLDALKQAVDSIGEAAQSLESVSQRAGTTFLAATGTLGMISLCALAWLVKFVRSRSS